MKKRCLNENNPSYKNYGGRGIKICQRWLDDFANFMNDMLDSYIEHVSKYGEKNTTLDRIDTNGNYEPSNCKWSTFKEQNNNQRRLKLLEVDGIKYTIPQFCEKFNFNYDTVYHRVRRGWSTEKILKTQKLETGKYERTKEIREKNRKGSYKSASKG